MQFKTVPFEVQVNSLFVSLQQCDWYADIIYYLMNLSCPTNFTKTQRRSLQLCAAKYCLWQGGLGWRNPDGIIWRCVDQNESREILRDLHLGKCGGHFSACTTAHKIMCVGYYRPTLFANAHAFMRTCEPC